MRDSCGRNSDRRVSRTKIILYRRSGVGDDTVFSVFLIEEYVNCVCLCIKTEKMVKFKKDA